MRIAGLYREVFLFDTNYRLELLRVCAHVWMRVHVCGCVFVWMHVCCICVNSSYLFSRMFPNCKYGNKCHFVHPVCKFDSR